MLLENFSRNTKKGMDGGKEEGVGGQLTDTQAQS